MIEVGLSVRLPDEGEKRSTGGVPECAVAAIGKDLIRNGGIVEIVKGQRSVSTDVHPVLGGGGAIPAAVGGQVCRHSGGGGFRQSRNCLIYRYALCCQRVDQDPGGGQFIVSRGASRGDNCCGHVIFGNDHQPCMVIQGVAALHQGLDAALGEGKPLHRVPAQAEGEHVQRVLRPDPAAVLGVSRGVQ